MQPYRVGLAGLAGLAGLLVGCGSGGSDAPIGDASSDASSDERGDTGGGDVGRDGRVPADGSGSDAPSDAGPLDEAQAEAACVAQASALCDRLEGCAPAFVRRTWVDGVDCRARARLGCLARVHVTDGYPPLEVAADCTAQLRAASCDTLFSRGRLGLDAFVEYPCPVVGGARGLDAPCIADAECGSGYCAYASRGCGVCRGAPGDGRSPADGYECGAWLVLGADKACHAPKVTGEPCDDANHPCAWNLSCVGGACAKGAAAGAACDATAGARCDWTAGLRCSGDATGPGTCVDAALATAGQACDAAPPPTALEGRVCGTASLCVRAAGGAASCVARRRDGAACDLDARCTPPATCVGGACAIPVDGDCR